MLLAIRTEARMGLRRTYVPQEIPTPVMVKLEKVGVSISLD